ncbi:MAG: hypothetical protein PHN72_07115, partial [Bacilli bacterium]|nr:hypothetical protein [Bacilli bacterium]
CYKNIHLVIQKRRNSWYNNKYEKGSEWLRTLFHIDIKDYDVKGTVAIRPSVRAIIICDGKIALVHSLKYDYYISNVQEK